MAELRTDRLVLRQWRDADLAPFAAMNGDPEVMRHFPATLSRAESDRLASRARRGIAQRGWGLWAVEVLDEEEPDSEGEPSADAGGRPGRFAGFIGLAAPSFTAHFTPAVEIGWRLARRFWGRGYASEGARAAAGFAFGEIGLAELVSFTAVGNLRSRRVMERLGMTHDPADDFDHPLLPGSPLERHVLYRLVSGGSEARGGSRARSDRQARSDPQTTPELAEIVDFSSRRSTER